MRPIYKVFTTDYHTVRELRQGSRKKCTILWITEVLKTGDWRAQFCRENFRFYRMRTQMTNPWMRYHTFIRLPFFWYERNDAGIRIGTWFHYLWFIRPVG